MPSSEMDLLLTEFLGRRGIEPDTLKLGGVIWNGDAGHLMFPRFGRDEEHDLPPDTVAIVGWKVRDLFSEKHFNSPRDISHQRTWPLMIRDPLPASNLFIHEGETDWLRMGQSRIAWRFNADVMCVPGSSAFPAEWASLVRTYSKVWIFGDGDDAGMLLPNRIASLVPGVRSVQMPEGEDVCSFLNHNSEDDLIPLIESAPLHLTKQKLRRENWTWSTGQADEHRSKLVRVVSKDVRLSQRGKELVGLCPFHEEKRPSFSINPDKGVYKCWGCGAAGDVINYLKEKRGIDFKEAMRVLKEIR